MHRWFLLLPLLAACAGGRATPSAPAASGADRERPTPSRIYSVGEQHFAAERYPEAVELWRHAVLELPQVPQVDDLRHALILRLSYGQLMAWQQTGDMSFLDDSQQMLERYLVRHESLFGESERATSQRDEVYEMLGQVELALHPTPYVDELETPSEEEDADLHAEDTELRRTVIVHTRARPSVDDPEIRRKLSSLFTDPFFDGLVLTLPSWAIVHGPRALMRAGGVARPTDDEPRSPAARRRARQLGRSVVIAARPTLKGCYEDAYGRDPVSVAKSVVELRINAQGNVADAKIIEGGLVDTLGDLCLLEGLESTQLAATEASEETDTLSIRLPLTFFYEGPVLFYEGSGTSVPAGVADKVHAVPGGSAGAPGRGGDRSAGPSRSMGA